MKKYFLCPKQEKAYNIEKAKEIENELLVLLDAMIESKCAQEMSVICPKINSLLRILDTLPKV